MRETLTQTKQRDFKACRRLFYLKHERGLRLRTARPGRRRGRAFARVLQDLRAERGDPREVVLASLERSYADASPSTQAEADELEVERVKLLVMALEYTARYGREGVRREVEWHLPLVNPATGHRSRTFDLGGKIDGVQAKARNHAVLIEDKLVQSISRVMIERLPLDAQTTEYALAFRSRGWTVEVAYRHNRFPGMNPKPEKVLVTKVHLAETLDEFEARLREDIAAHPASYFDEQRLHFPDSHLQAHADERWQLAKAILHTRKTNSWFKTEGHCFEYGGCEFIPLCAGFVGAEDLYVRSEDNPELELGHKRWVESSEGGTG